MIVDSEIKNTGMSVLIREMGEVEAERFITLLIREPFDYTEWQKGLWKHETVEGLSRQAMKYVSAKHSEDGTK